MPATLAIKRGKILAYRVFDAGETIDLDLAAARHPDAHRLDIGGPLVEGLVIRGRPLEMELGDHDVVIPRIGRRVKARVRAHAFEFGALSILYEIPIEAGSSLIELTPICDALYDAIELEPEGPARRKELVKSLGDSIERPHDGIDAETYTIVFIEELDGSIDDLKSSEAAAKLLLGETCPKALSPAVREDVLKNAFSYYSDDLVVIDWNSAIVVEPTGSRVVPHVLEFATCQLLEFRFFDETLDRELAKVYEHVGKGRTRVFRSPYRALTRQVLRRFMELTEFTERVDNAIKSVGDFYLARVYLAAIGRFRVPEWRESVESKLALVGKAYELLKGDVEVSRTQLLEIIVVILILVELITAFRGH